MRRSVANNYNNYLHGYLYLLVCALKILLFKMLSLYIYSGQANIGRSSNFNIYIRHYSLARRLFRKHYLFCVYILK